MLDLLFSVTERIESVEREAAEMKQKKRTRKQTAMSPCDEVTDCCGSSGRHVEHLIITTENHFCCVSEHCSVDVLILDISLSINA